MNIAIVPGHDVVQQGARNPKYPAWGENTYAHRVVPHVRVPGHVVRVFLRPPDVSYADALAELTGAVNEWGADVAVEVHFNSIPDANRTSPHFRGTFGIHHPRSERGQDLARVLGKAVASILGTRSCWPMAMDTSHGGLPLYFLQKTCCPACILETHNCYDVQAHEYAILHPDRVAVGISQGLHDYVDLHDDGGR